ncbi:hypothetical protein G6F68_016111 [Rhizopus microsporus]|nr:hypothetical protein G6F68_016111 [Rhizopus microsporus]
MGRQATPAWRRTRDSGATQAPTPAAASSSARRKDPACAAGALAAAPGRWTASETTRLRSARLPSTGAHRPRILPRASRTRPAPPAVLPERRRPRPSWRCRLRRRSRFPPHSHPAGTAASWIPFATGGGAPAGTECARLP